MNKVSVFVDQSSVSAYAMEQGTENEYKQLHMQIQIRLSLNRQIKI
jgi:hypothetical protein